MLGFELDGLGDDQKKLGEMGARASRFVDAREKYELGTALLRSRRRCVPLTTLAGSQKTIRPLMIDYAPATILVYPPPIAYRINIS